jgi:glutamate decarboxylase
MQDTAVLRIVIRNGFSLDMARLLLADLRVQVRVLDSQPHPPTPLIPGTIKDRQGFAH